MSFSRSRLASCANLNPIKSPWLAETSITAIIDSVVHKVSEFKIIRRKL